MHGVLIVDRRPQPRGREIRGPGERVLVDDPLLGLIAMPGPVPKFSRTPGHVWSTGPYVGEHADEIFGTLLGYSAEKIAQLRASGAI